MTTQDAQVILDELNTVQPSQLTNEARKLFEAIMKIADERDILCNRVKELGKGQQTLMQSRRKWKKRYYNIRNKLKEVQKYESND